MLYFDLEKKDEEKEEDASFLPQNSSPGFSTPLQSEKPFKQFSPLISGLKFGRKHSLDFAPAFSLDASHFQNQQREIENSLNRSLALDDTGVDDLLKESSRAGLGEEEESGWEGVLEKKV